MFEQYALGVPEALKHPKTPEKKLYAVSVAHHTASASQSAVTVAVATLVLISPLSLSSVKLTLTLIFLLASVATGV